MTEYSLVCLSDGVRLDKFLAESEAGLSRSAAVGLIEEGRVLVNGNTAAKKLKLKAGDRVELSVPDPVEYAVDDFTDILTFSFDDGTTLRLEFEEYNWVKDGKKRCHVEGLGPLRSLLEGLLDNDGNTEGQAAMKMLIGETEVPVTWEDNKSVAALRELLPLTVQMSMYGGFEQVGSVGQSITRDDHETITDYGDIVLYSGDQIVVFYGTNTWAYTRLGHIDLSQDELEELLGNGDVTITLMEDQ